MQYFRNTAGNAISKSDTAPLLYHCMTYPLNGWIHCELNELTVLAIGTVGSCPGLAAKARVPPVVIATEGLYPANCVCARISICEKYEQEI